MIYVMAAALSNGSPPLHSSALGPPLLLLVVNLFGLLVGYSNTMTFVLLRQALPEDQVQLASQLGGVVTQLGTCLGAGLATLLVGSKVLHGKL